MKLINMEYTTRLTGRVLSDGRKLMLWLLEVLIVNTYILYQKTVVSPLSHADFRCNVVVGLCEQWSIGDVRMMMQPRDGERFQGGHYLE